MLCLLFLCLHSTLLDNYSTDLCNGDLQNMITLFKQTASSHKTDRTSLTHSPTLPCLLYDRVRQFTLKFLENESL